MSDIPDGDNVETVGLEGELDVVVPSDEVPENIQVGAGSSPLYEILAGLSLSSVSGSDMA